MEYKPMEKRTLSIAVLLVGILSLSAFLIFAQDDNTRLHVVVNLVQLNVAVTDNKGNYVTSLRPSDFAVSEDGISESIATFEEGNGPTTRLAELTAEDGFRGRQKAQVARAVQVEREREREVCASRHRFERQDLRAESRTEEAQVLGAADKRNLLSLPAK